MDFQILINFLEENWDQFVAYVGGEDVAQDIVDDLAEM